MKVVVLNAGSGSQKCSLFELPVDPLFDEPYAPIWEAKLDSTAPGQPKGKLAIRISRHEEDIEVGRIDEGATTAERTERLLRMLWEESAKMVSQSSEVDVIGHRLVHGGAEFREAARVTVNVEPTIERCVHFAPLHNPSNLTGIRVALQLFGENKPQFAIFDTAFHCTLSDAAASYAASRVWIDQGIRRTVSMARASATQAGVRRNCSGESTPAAIRNLGSRAKKPIPKEGSLSCGS
jgi:acetate kinase